MSKKTTKKANNKVVAKTTTKVEKNTVSKNKRSFKDFISDVWIKIKEISLIVWDFLKRVWAVIVKYSNTSNKKNWVTVLGQIIIYIVLIVMSFVFLSPFIDMITKSVMSTEDVLNPEIMYIAHHFTLTNYQVVMSETVMNYWPTLWNSIWVSSLFAIIETFTCAVTAYAIARYNFKGKKFIIVLLVLAFIIPSITLSIPRRVFFTNMRDVLGFKVLGTIMPTTMYTFFGQGVFASILILIFYNFFKQIPYDLDEAAYIDGASTYQVFYHIILKLSMPIILTVFLFAFVWNWNDSVSINAFIAVGTDSLDLIPYSTRNIYNLNSIAGSGGQTLHDNEGYLGAGTLLTVIPLIVLYLFVQRRFIEGIEQTGITGV